MQTEYIITEIYNADEKKIDDKLQDVFIIFLTEKLINTHSKIEK